MDRLLAVNRHQAILQRLDETKTATVEGLATSLGVSRETIRRDLKHLAAGGLLTIVHGGAVRREQSEAPLADRREANRLAKAAIAELAVGLVSDGMAILLDSGTTTEALAEMLARSGRQRLVIHTTSLIAARLAARLAGATVKLIGGEFDPNDDATSGAEARRAVSRLSVDIAFVGVGGIDEDGCFSDYTRTAADLRATMLRAGERSYFLADHSKFGIRLASALPELQQASGLLTDRPPAPSASAALGSRGIKVVTPSG
ncbi:DeoR/GlpR family DNA-binding transcription regulator [Bosea sp. (in: a-proteobacteria)]|uniref:DeoR/GlpR family DNA-binding transcription regulator n=1 Tax=Bosea sp. (in: a-proteobacteria) TaxID=1871050 RepID=UPI002FC7432A